MISAKAAVVLMFLGLPFLALGQVSAEAVATAGEKVELSLGVFTFSLGEKLALEITREDPCPCLYEEILVNAFKLLGEEGEVVFVDDTWEYPVAAAKWIGRWDFRDPSRNPVAPGRYTAAVETSPGTFRAEIEILPRGEFPSGKASVEASVCGISLAVYRLIEKGDAGGTVTLRPGEKLMVALPGNPTTGYTWEAVEEPLFLEFLEVVDYVPETDLVGGGGTFCFRYLARDPGTGALSFVYRRPWEESPIESFSITVIVTD